MKNQDIMQLFAKKGSGYTVNACSNGVTLVNYSTVIANHLSDNTVAFNTSKYSSTTSKIQTQLKSILQDNNFKIIEVKGVDLNE